MDIQISDQGQDLNETRDKMTSDDSTRVQHNKIYYIKLKLIYQYSNIDDQQLNIQCKSQLIILSDI